MKGEIISFQVVQRVWALRRGTCPKCRSHLVYRGREHCFICGWRAHSYVEPYVFCKVSD